MASDFASTSAILVCDCIQKPRGAMYIENDDFRDKKGGVGFLNAE